MIKIFEEYKEPNTYYIIATATFKGSSNYSYEWQNEFKNTQEALEWMFINYYIDVDPDPDLEDDLIKQYYGKDIKVVKFTREDAIIKEVEDALENIKMKAQTKKYNI